MTETTGIRQDVLTPAYHPTAPSHSSLPEPASATVLYKRKILDRWTTRITASGLPGSVGNCVVCHTRHSFSIAEARKPAACALCHFGPDHPDIEIFNNSKHGQIYNSEGDTWNYTSAPDAWEPGDYRASTCAVCHMSGIGELETTHNVSDRLKWNLWAPKSEVRNSPDPMSPLTGGRC